MSAAFEGAGLDVLAIGPHPDDVELFCGGTLAALAARGYRVGILDLTRGELATNGTPEQRAVEAGMAAEVLGVVHRENLGLPDGCVGYVSVDAAHGAMQYAEGHVGRLVAALRRLRPEVVMAPAWRERHPDHEAASALATRAVFFANVGGFATPGGEARWKVREVLYYPMRVAVEPSLCVDISAARDAKRDAIACYGSQVARTGGDLPTMVNDPRSTAAVFARDAYWGAHIGVDAAEPFVTRSTLGVADPVALLRGRAGEPLLFPEGP